VGTAGDTAPGGRVAQALAAPVHIGTTERRFGELTVGEVEAQAAELRGVGGWGPLQRVVPVARAWAELAGAMREAKAESVAELEPEAVLAYAERTWVLPPPEGLI
jgi:hypothetical protein